MESVGLMVEGGAMRIAYTAGVLEYFLERNLMFKTLATASAGAIISSSYLAEQQGRNFEIIRNVSHNRDAVSVKRLLAYGEIFNMDYLFNTIPNDLLPLDFKTFKETKSRFIIATTDIDKGQPHYFNEYESLSELNTVSKASCSLPLLSPSVRYQQRELMDGGVASPLIMDPLHKMGFKKNVVIMTRAKSYFKRAPKYAWLYRHLREEKPKLHYLLKNRHIIYNRMKHKVYKTHSGIENFIIQPENPILISRIDNSYDKLSHLFELGYNDAKRKFSELEQFLHKK